MKDINAIRLSGSIFWSKLDDRQTFSLLRLGIGLEERGGVFAVVNNPSEKSYESIKPGNKVVLTNAWLDIWEKQDGSSELQIKVNGNGVVFFPKEKVISGINEVTILGTVKELKDNMATIEMVGDRSPKTGKFAIRSTIINIGEEYTEKIIGNKILLKGEISSVEDDNKKSHLIINADYSTINIL